MRFSRILDPLFVSSENSTIATLMSRSFFTSLFSLIFLPFKLAIIALSKTSFKLCWVNADVLIKFSQFLSFCFCRRLLLIFGQFWGFKWDRLIWVLRKFCLKNQFFSLNNIWPQHTVGFSRILGLFFSSENSTIATLMSSSFFSSLFFFNFSSFQTGHNSFIKNFFQIMLGQCRCFNKILTTQVFS